MIYIPIHIWETVRHLGGARLDLVDLLDEDLLAKVQKDVDERIAEYERDIRARITMLRGAVRESETEPE